MENIVKIENLSVDSSSTRVLEGFNLTIPKGQRLGIVGESGSGKTLSMQTLLGFLPRGFKASYKTIQLFGSDPYDLSEGSLGELLGRKIGYIPQNTSEYLHPMIKIKNQIGDSFLSYNSPDKASMLNRAVDLLDKVAVQNPQEVLNQYPYNLSGGLRQRVNIAMAMMSRPELLIADEPTTALDVTSQYQVMELLKTIHQKNSTSQIIISHDLSLIKNYTDYVLVIYQGQTQEYGPTQEIFKNPQADYTKALLSVAVDLNTDKTQPLKDISYYFGRKIIL